MNTKLIRLLPFTACLMLTPGASAQNHPKMPSQRTQPPKQQAGQAGPQGQPPMRPPMNAQRAQFGDPLPGLNQRELQEFLDGKAEFENTETEAGGLGPIFNHSSCVSCHSGPATGGSSEITVTRFGKSTNGVFDALDSLGGSLLQSQAINPAVQEVVPPEANVTAQRRSTALFGLGLVEAIPDGEILRNARQRPQDGVLGKPSFVLDVASGKTRVGRFGWKAQQATLLAFSGDAYLNEMGVTSRLFPVENAPNGNQALLQQYDQIMDPEDTVDPATGLSDIDHSANFMRWLGAPPRRAPTRNSALGERLFHGIGCAICHVPMLMTGPHRSRALDRKPVFAWSDFLLHDMGSLGDGITQGRATAREMKTAPLWGLGAQTSLLHDGRARTIDEAIRAHDGEGKNSKDRYAKLTDRDRAMLLEFLQTL
ncbi:MAG: hypothetical protein IPK32_10925 [Verrucomicrobiaceae bacterium]|nr:hypothetical protein [Verrucomicrobiaceae bacterium]